MIHTLRRLAAVLACAAACLSLGACEPAGKAVGDTQESEPDVAHVGEIRSDVTVGLIGAPQDDDGTDALVLDALDAAGLHTVYVSTGQVSDPVAAAQQGVEDLVRRRVSIVVIDGLQVSGDTAGLWDKALKGARVAGIPVALLDPASPPSDDTLYAAALTLDADDAGAVPIDGALMTIIDDDPHGRAIAVTASAD